MQFESITALNSLNRDLQYLWKDNFDETTARVSYRILEINTDDGVLHYQPMINRASHKPTTTYSATEFRVNYCVCAIEATLATQISETRFFHIHCLCRCDICRYRYADLEFDGDLNFDATKIHIVETILLKNMHKAFILGLCKCEDQPCCCPCPCLECALITVKPAKRD